jgi:hypothetical protein
MASVARGRETLEETAWASSMPSRALLDDESEERARAKMQEWRSSSSRFSARDEDFPRYGEQGRNGAISRYGELRSMLE